MNDSIFFWVNEVNDLIFNNLNMKYISNLEKFINIKKVIFSYV